MDTIETRTIRKISRRLLPLLFVSFIAAYLDRVNVGFAALGMNHDLGLTTSAFAAGGGIFFIGYFLFEVPSNYLLEKVGARAWISRIMISWGVISGLNAFVWDAHSFYAVRFLLGIAEAGFFPGVVLFLTYWFPARYHGKAIGTFLLGVPVSVVFGSLLSGLLLGLEGTAGLHGWQWLFVLEAVPSVILGIVIMIWLPSRPDRASWLSPEEKEWLRIQLANDEAGRAPHAVKGFAQSLKSGKVLAFGLTNIGIVSAMYGVVFFMPTIVKGFGLSNALTGVVVAVPYAFAIVSIILWNRHSDRTGERAWHAALVCFLGAIGLIGSVMFDAPVYQLLSFGIATIGIFTAMTTFWTLPPTFLAASASAGGLALINSLGNVGGFVGPYVVGYVKDASGTYETALAMLGVLIFITGVLILLLCRKKNAGAVADIHATSSGLAQ